MDTFTDNSHFLMLYEGRSDLGNALMQLIDVLPAVDGGIGVIGPVPLDRADIQLVLGLAMDKGQDYEGITEEHSRTAYREARRIIGDGALATVHEDVGSDRYRPDPMPFLSRVTIEGDPWVVSLIADLATAHEGLTIVEAS